LNQSMSPRIYKHYVYSSSCMLKSIMSDVLDLSVLEMGMFRLEHQPFSLLSELSHIVYIVSPAAECKPLKFLWEHNLVEMPVAEKGTTTLRVSDGATLPLHVVGDRVRLRQILMSLIGYDFHLYVL
jgi:signal transduction histidine kinase